MSILNTAVNAFKNWRAASPVAAPEKVEKAFGTFNPAADAPTGERGDRVASDVAMDRLYRQMWVDTERRALIRQIRVMDEKDPRVKRIHGRSARDTIRGGLVFQGAEKSSSETLKREWTQFKGRLQLDIEGKLKSDARGFVMEGNLPLQLVLNDDRAVVAALRMPSDTMVPITDMGGRFKDSCQREGMPWPRMKCAVGQLHQLQKWTLRQAACQGWGVGSGNYSHPRGGVGTWMNAPLQNFWKGQKFANSPKWDCRRFGSASLSGSATTTFWTCGASWTRLQSTARFAGRKTSQ